jgi:hypothetical protein
MTSGETLRHAQLKKIALAWAFEQGLSISAPEVSFPHRRFRVDAAACSPVRKVPARRPALAITSVLKTAVVFECKQVRSDLVRDNKRRRETSERLRTLEARRIEMESLLQLHLPHLANGESLFPEMDSYRFREVRHAGYEKLTTHIQRAKRAIAAGTKFDRLMAYRIANLHYLVIEQGLIDTCELPVGWGLLVREGDAVRLMEKPVWQNIGIEEQLVFLQRVACAGRGPRPVIQGSEA